MIAFNAYRAGIRQLLGQKKMWLLLYLFNFLFAIFILWPLHGLMGDSVGHSLMLSDRAGIDFVLISEFVNQFGERFSDWLRTSFPTVLLYFVFSIFLMGGILQVFKLGKRGFSASQFWGGSSRFFWRILRLSFYFFLFQALLFFLFFRIYSACGLNPLCIESDADLVQRFRWMFAIYVALAILVFMYQDYCKIHLVYQDQHPIRASLWSGIGLVSRNLRACLSLYLLQLGIALGILTIYWQATDGWAVDGSLGQLSLLFLVGQLLVFVRIGLKLLNLASANCLYRQFTTYQGRAAS